MSRYSTWEEAAKSAAKSQEAAQGLRNAGFILPDSVKGTVTEAQPVLQVVRTPKQEAAARMAAKADDSVTDVMSGTKKTRSGGFLGGVKSKAGDLYGSYRKRPWWQQAIVPGAGALTLGGLLFGGDDKTAVDINKLDFNTTEDQLKESGDYYQRQREVINDTYANLPELNIPGAEMYDPLSGVSNQIGAATIAEMQRLANDAANQAAAIQAAGVQGAAGINNVYGGAANEMSNLASYGGEYGSMTPVSGAAATAPEQARMQGQNLANFLQQNQLISAQDAGFLAQLAPQISSGYANQLALNDYMARAQQDMLRQRKREEMIYQRELERQSKLGDLALEQARNEALIRAGKSAPITQEELDFYGSEWENASNSLKQIWAKQLGIQSVEDYINWKIANPPQQPQG